jgi:hypothetical protein
VKRTALRIDEPNQPRNIQRADTAPTNEYASVVNGHFKTQFSGQEAAQKAGSELLANFPMLQVEIYGATTKSRIRLNSDGQTALTFAVMGCSPSPRLGSFIKSTTIEWRVVLRFPMPRSIRKLIWLRRGSPTASHGPARFQQAPRILSIFRAIAMSSPPRLWLCHRR